MSVFLTPGPAAVLTAGPISPRGHVRPAGVRVGFALRGIDAAYCERRNDVNQTADQLVTILRGISEPEGVETPMTIGRRAD